MKRIAFFLGILIIFSSCNSGTDNNSKVKTEIDNRKLAFQNNEFISCYNFSTGRTENLTEGFDPCISPDGKWIAYTESTVSGNNYSRTVKLINIENSTIKDLAIKDKNHYGAIWSPTGEHLAFCIMPDDWQIGLTEPDGSGFKIISTDSGTGLYAPTWSRDGKFIFAHNLSVLYKFAVSGELIEKYDLSQMLGDNFYLSSSTRFCFTSDNKKVIFNSGIDEFLEGLHEPISAIFCYDFSTKAVTRISKTGLCARDLWIDSNDRIYFSGFENTNKPERIYQTSITDTALTELINGMRPSIGQ